MEATSPIRSEEPGPSACEWLVRLEKRQLSSRELTAHFSERISQVNPDINAVVGFDPEQTLDAADQADRLRLAGSTGRLLGLPITVKDSIDVEGFRSTGGSYARERFRPSRDATAVARLRAEGAVILGKTNVPEYIASYETDNAIFGRTNNPIDLTRTPGGSSGGEAAILRAGGSCAGLGSDGGGSIRVPAHYCGVVGFRPTVGIVPETGAWPSLRSRGLLDIHTIGPMGRHVEDLALLLGVMSGPDWIDPYCVPVAIGDWRDGRTREMRVAFYLDDELARPTAETREAVVRAATELEHAGAEIFEVTPPMCVRTATELFLASAGADGGARMREDVAVARGRHTAQFAAHISARSAAGARTAREFFDLLERVHSFRSELRDFVSRFDAVICPVVAGPAPFHGRPPAGVPMEMYGAYEAFNYTHTFSLAGLPAVSVPIGVDLEGLPIGVQVIGGAYRDHVSLAVAAFLQQQFETPVRLGENADQEARKD